MTSEVYLLELMYLETKWRKCNLLKKKYLVNSLCPDLFNRKNVPHHLVPHYLAVPGTSTSCACTPWTTCLIIMHCSWWCGERDSCIPGVGGNCCTTLSSNSKNVCAVSAFFPPGGGEVFLHNPTTGNLEETLHQRPVRHIGVCTHIAGNGRIEPAAPRQTQRLGSGKCGTDISCH